MRTGAYRKIFIFIFLSFIYFIPFPGHFLDDFFDLVWLCFVYFFFSVGEGVFLGFDFSLDFNNIYTHYFLTFLFLTRVPFDLLFGFTSEFLLGFFKQKLRTQKIKTKNSPFPNHFYEPLSAFNCLGVAQNNHCETTATIHAMTTVHTLQQQQQQQQYQQSQNSAINTCAARRPQT